MFDSVEFINQHQSPLIMFTGTGVVALPENLRKALSDHPENRRLTVILFEPLALYTKSATGRAYGDIPSHCDPKQIRSVELDSLEDQLRDLDLDISVYTCDYGLDDLRLVYPKMELFCLDIFLRSFKFDLSIPRSTAIEKKFFCGNWRYALHRNLMMAYLSRLEGNYTWYFKVGFKTLQENMCFDFSRLDRGTYKKIRQGIEIINTKDFALNQGYEKTEVTRFSYSHYPKITERAIQVNSKDLLAEKICQCFCMVVTETRFFQPTANFSEKLLSSFLVKRPFLAVAPPRTLEYAKKLGFKTFDLWWDESYDQETDHQKRLLALFEIIDQLDRLSIEKMASMLIEMKDVLDYNYARFLDLKNDMTVC